MTGDVARAAIVDFGLGNLYSVARACAHAKLDTVVTSDPRELASADGILLPGVGAFGDAMDVLNRLDLSGALREAAVAGTPILGVCLGAQLLMSHSEEFGHHDGLDILPGSVVRFDRPREGECVLKVPQICWNGIFRPSTGSDSDPWIDTPLEGLADGEPMYFVHSYCVQPRDSSIILSTTGYGHIQYCSSVRRGNIVAFQFHPERSGQAGLKIYESWARLLRRRMKGNAPA